MKKTRLAYRLGLAVGTHCARRGWDETQYLPFDGAGSGEGKGLIDIINLGEIAGPPYHLIL